MIKTTKKIIDKLDSHDFINRMERGGVFNTSIDVICPETGEVIFKGLKNKVVIAGSGFIARHLFDIGSKEVTPSYNELLALEEPEGEDTSATSTNPLITGTAATKEAPKVLLFCVGIDGCGTAANEVFTVKYKSIIKPKDLIPFRYPLKYADLSDEQRNIYFGRKEAGAFGEIPSNDYYAYYFKRFDGDPILVQQYILDNAPVTEDVYDDQSNFEIESYIEVKFTVSREDLREYFEATTGIDDARFNSISLCYAYPVEIDGKVFYKDIRPMTKLHFPSENMAARDKSCEIRYRIFVGG